jgi:hypothetical protein
MQIAGSVWRARTTTARMLAGAVAGAALILTLVAAAPAAGPRAGTGTITSDNFQLNAVSALSPSDAWAVGNGGRTLHWDGTSWSPVTLPGGSGLLSLSAVDAVSSSDVWAVGSRVKIQTPNPPLTRTLIVHWDGTAWRRVPSPGPSNTNLIPELTSVSMDSATDGWALGDVQNRTTGADTSLMAHWNGTRWQQVTTKPGFVFNGVASLSPTDATAAGAVQTTPSTFAAAVFRWNGTTWARTATLHAPPGVSATVNTTATGLSAQSATDMWATGFYRRGFGRGGNLAWHWDGTRWAVTTMPGGLPIGGLLGVAAISPTDVWAVGYQRAANGGTRTLIVHWDGTSWTQVPAPHPRPRIIGPPTNPPDFVLNGVSADSASDVWAVGYHQTAVGNRFTLILHWDGTAWTQS